MKSKIDPNQDIEEIVIDLTTNEADVDWLKARRLLKEDTPEALAELERMKSTPMVKIDPEAEIK